MARDRALKEFYVRYDSRQSRVHAYVEAESKEDALHGLWEKQIVDFVDYEEVDDVEILEELTDEE